MMEASFTGSWGGGGLLPDPSSPRTLQSLSMGLSLPSLVFTMMPFRRGTQFLLLNQLDKEEEPFSSSIAG